MIFSALTASALTGSNVSAVAPASSVNTAGQHSIDSHLSFDRIEGGRPVTPAGAGDLHDAYLAAQSEVPANSLVSSSATTQLDPWGVAAGAVGAAIGTVLGGGIGGVGGGAGGTLVAPGIGTIGGGIAGGAEGAALGGVAGAGIGYGVGAAVHGIINWMTQSSTTGGSGVTGDDSQKPDPSASKPYRDDPGRLEGRSASDVEKELDQSLVKDGHWTKSPSRDGNGVRYLDGKGGSIIINKGYPDGIPGGDAVHQGPYVKIQPGGVRVPLAGNSAVGS